MASLSGVIGRRITVRPKQKDDWSVVPILWGMAVGPPGELKTPAMDEVLAPLRQLQDDAMRQHEEALKRHAAEGMVREQRKRVAQEAIREQLKKRKYAAARALARETVRDAESPPTCRRWLTNDVTVEKLGELLAENPNGLLLYRDELTGFFRTLERQGHEGDRAFYLESWNGKNPFIYDRIGRGTLRIPTACVAILGTIQPGPLSAFVRSTRATGDDGLLARFQLAVYPDPTASWKNVDRQPNEVARSRVVGLVRRIARMKPLNKALHFDDEGQELYDAWRAKLERRLRTGDLHPAMETHLSKYRSLVPALALICYVAVASDGFVGPISKRCVQRAIAWAEYLEAHARRIYVSAISPDVDAARALSKRLMSGDLGDRFAMRDVYRHGWTGLSGVEDTTAAVRVLIDYGWLREEHNERTGGRPGTLYTVNPLLRKATKLRIGPKRAVRSADKTAERSSVSSVG
jgi:hypothetical protein